MNMTPDGEVVVLDLAGRVAVLLCRGRAIKPTLHTLGFAPAITRMERTIANNADRKQLAGLLISLDVLFAEGAGWSPAELLSLYRERGALPGPYRTIGWFSPCEFRITQHPGQIETRFTISHH